MSRASSLKKVRIQRIVGKDVTLFTKSGGIIRAHVVNVFYARKIVRIKVDGLYIDLDYDDVTGWSSPGE